MRRTALLPRAHSEALRTASPLGSGPVMPRGTARRHSTPAICLLFVLLLLPGGLLAQVQPPQDGGPQCPQGEVTGIFIDNHSIFDPVSIPEERYLRWAYRAANGIHVRTRESFIAQELLFREGDCYDPLLVQESARVLREFRFIAAADVYAIPQPDGSRHVVVDTRDEWTTKLSVGVRFDDGLQIDGASIVEENFLGRGATVGFVHMEREEQRSTGGLLELPRVRGSGWDMQAAASRTRVGNSYSQRFEHPLVGEVGTHGFRQRFHSRHDLFNWTLPEGDSLTHLILPVREGGAEVTAARRFGVPGHLLILGGGFSHEWVRTGPLNSLQGIADRDFGAPLEVDPDVGARLASQQTDRTTTRANAMIGVRRINYVQRVGLDALRGLQDIRTGREAVLTVGQSLRRQGDLFGRVDLFGGFATDRWVGQLHGTVEGRQIQGSDAGSHDVLAELHTFLYRSIEGPVEQTLLLRGTMQGGWRMEAPFQLTLGGPDGIRGLREHEWPGGRRFIVSFEDRVVLPGPFRDLMDLGLTLFGDLGRMYAADVPFGTDSGWQGSVGTGLRVGFPAGSAAVIRADIAMAFGRDAPGEPVIRIHAREWLGTLGEFRNADMERARRSGVRSEFVGVGRGSGR